MIKKNKALLLAALGVASGGILGAVMNSAQMDLYTAAAVGGVIGFLIGWLWQSRTA